MAKEMGEPGSEEFADLVPVDPIEALEAELRRARGLHAPETAAGEVDAAHSATKPSAAPSRGAANFQAWCETRRQLDGAESTFDVEFVSPDGERRVVDLLKLGFDELPPPIRAEFELRKFPDFASLMPSPADAHTTAAKDGAGGAPDAENAVTEGGERRWPAERDPQAKTHSPKSHASTADDDTSERPRPGPVPAALGGGFGIHLGGIVDGAGRAASSALASLREGVKALAAPARGPMTHGVHRWREHRARTALATLETSMAHVAHALEATRRHAELKDVFRAWEALKTDEGRAKARARFQGRLAASAPGAWSAEARALVATLFSEVAALRAHSDDALKRAHRAGQDVGPLKARLSTWLQNARAQAGPITNAAGESLADTLKVLAEAVRRCLESLTQRIAHFAAPRPT